MFIFLLKQGQNSEEKARVMSLRRENDRGYVCAFVSRTFWCRDTFAERLLTPTLPLIITLMHNAASLLFTHGRRSRDAHDLRSYCNDSGTYPAAYAVRLCQCIAFFLSRELSIRRTSWRLSQSSSSCQFTVSLTR